MDVLSIIRDKLEKGKDRCCLARIDESSNLSPVKEFPLRNQNQNRLVQIMHREPFSSSDIYTTKLHRGILNDWLAAMFVNSECEVLSLSATGILAIVNSCLWNSHTRFRQICGTNDAVDIEKSCSQLSLVDFSILVPDLPVLDTRLSGVPQSHATCIQSVLGDNCLVTVYHKALDSSVRPIAKGRVAAASPVSSTDFPHVQPFSGNLSEYFSLSQCYDLPPSLIERVLQQALQAVVSDEIVVITPLLLQDVRSFWINHANLASIWCNKFCLVHYKLSEDHKRLLVGLSAATTAGDKGAGLVLCMEVMIPARYQQVGRVWELHSTWVPCPVTVSVSSAPVTALAILTSMDVLLVGSSLDCADLESALTSSVRKLQCLALPACLSASAPPSPSGTCAESKEGQVATHQTFDTWSADTTQSDVAVLVLPLSAGLPGDASAVDLPALLSMLQSLCTRCSRLIVLCTAPTDPEGRVLVGEAVSQSLVNVLNGMLVTAQLEFLKCSISLMHIQTPQPSAHMCEALACELSAATTADSAHELEARYTLPISGTSLQRWVSRYTSRTNTTAPPHSVVAGTETSNWLDPTGVYVVTGGLGGLGLLTAHCLARRGAKHIALVSRSGAVPYTGQGLEEQLTRLRGLSGVTILILRCDLSKEAEVVRMLESVRAVGHLAGTIHAAGVLRDGLIVTGKAAAGAHTVWDAKAKSAYLLHKHTQSDTRLHLFLTYSSVTAAVGTAGQAAYAGANRYLESLMHLRRQAGLPGQAVRWPEVSGIGMAAALHGSAATDGSRECAISPDQVEELLLQLLGDCTDAIQSKDDDATLTLLPPALVELYRPAKIGLQLSLIPSFEQPAVLLSDAPAQSSETSATPTPQTVRHIVCDKQVRSAVRRILAALLDDCGEGELRDDALLMQSGLDSLGATELSAQLSGEFGIKVPPTLIFNFPSVDEIVAYLLAALAPVQAPQSAPVVATEAVKVASVAVRSAAGVTGLEEVAIIGTSLSFPGNCSSLERLWDILVSKESTSVPTPTDRWDVDALLASNGVRDPACLARLQSSHFLTHAEPFNCVQFNMTAKEAAVMHPSHKLLLINCHRALQDAGYVGDKLCANTGVFVGIGGVVSGSGSATVPVPTPDSTGSIPGSSSKPASTMSAYSATSNTVSVSAGRISFSLGLSGPCMAIDTACSSSLVALHAARRSLQLGECDLALVCGVNCLDASSSLACAVAGMTSPDGVCRTFDQSANGYSRAEGCGVVVLKRLSDAVRDDDAVHSVVKGSAVRQDGKSASLTAPNGRAQQELIRAALRDAQLQPADVLLLETHGTGTKLGDPVEAAALAEVFGQRIASGAVTSPPLYLTAVKANVGHLEAGAGMAGLFSILLALQHRVAPPNALLHSLNEEVRGAIGDASLLPIVTATPLVAEGGRALVAAVSSFGYSGTIAHVILQEAPVGVRRHQPAVPVVEKAAPGVVAAESSEADTHEFVEAEGDQVWQFAGQGDMRAGLGQELYDTEPAFRTAMDECDIIVRPLLGRSISEMLYPPATSTSSTNTGQQDPLSQTANSQVTLVALEYCLAAVWLAQGMAPGIVLGHSLGEYAAAVVAGVLTLSDALQLVCARGRLVQESSACQGVMYAVRANCESIHSALQRASSTVLAAASVAACNGSMSFVLSGSEVAVQQLLSLLPPRTGSVRLGVAHAFHSPLMRHIEAPFRAVLKKVKFNPLQSGVRFVSTVRGEVVSSAEISTVQYWVDHMLLEVRYTAAVQCAYRLGGRTFLEMGPQDTLTKLSRRVLEAKAKAAGAQASDVETLASLM